MDTTNECVQALNNLGIATREWDVILTYIVSERLSPDTKKLWEQRVGATREFPKFDELRTFLEAQFRALEALGNNNVSTSRQSTFKHSFQSVKSYSCVVCSASHPLWHCPEFLKLDHSGKRNIVINKHLCSNCLAKGHNASHCPSRTSCYRCRHRHHTLLHNEEVIASKARAGVTHANNEGSGDSRISDTDAVPSSSQVYVGNVSIGNEVLLPTALAKLVGKDGHSMVVRALVDQGSQASFIKESIIRRLHIPSSAVNITISGIEDIETGVAQSQATVELRSLHNNCKLLANVLVLKQISTVLPPRAIRKNVAWKHLQGLTLADPTYNLSSKIDMVIGADILGRIILNGLRVDTQGSPIAQNTILGWILSGEIEEKSKLTTTVASYHCKISLDEQLRRFWELEEVQPVKYLTEEEKACEKHYKDTVQRTEGGRYMVRLPFRSSSPPEFGRSRWIALSRLRKLELAFDRDEQLRLEYTKCLEEYLELNHMELAPSTEMENIKVNHGNQVWYKTNYLPHHGVFKESSTTKLRVVFDASSRTANGCCLNEVLMTGPTLQDDLMTLLLRWRKHQVVLTADIEKMYRQIWVHDDDADYQRILWRKSPSAPIQDYRLKTVTFGTSSAPYLAVRTLQQLARDESERYPLASRITLSDFYVDDMLTGTNSIESAQKLQDQIIQLLKAGGFNLRKWASNRPELLANIPDEDKELSGIRNFDFGERVKTLGMHWYPRLDVFKYNIDIEFGDSITITKRKFLSEVSKIFDPLGFLSPVTIKPKMMMQAIWLKGIDWDEEIPNDIFRVWNEIRNQFKMIKDIKIPRWIGTTSDAIEIHGFCDGSLQAYAAVLYARSIYSSGNVNVTILAAKTKVTPIKQISLPRIELCGAALLARLYKAVTKAMKFTHVKFRAWTDSTTVLAWLRNHPNKYKTFVANRVAEVQEICGSEAWNHVPTQENPADCATRGLLPAEAIRHQLWWNGPQWLQKPEEQWPSLRDITDTGVEMRTIKVNLNTTTEPTSSGLNICRYSSLRKLIRVIAYVLRFITRCKSNKGPNITKWLTSRELDEAHKVIIKQVQAQEFHQDLKHLSSNGKPSSGRLLKLNPFIDHMGVLRVGGRLQNANISWTEKHPIILPSQHHITDLIIDDMHRITLHGGPQLVLGLLRREYWILRARSAVRARIHKCMICFRQRAECCSQLMGSLPAPRTNISRPFSHVGVDYCGPMDIKSSKLRNAKKYKCYLAIFVCLAVKAVHIEVVSDLSTDAFLAAFKRFTARRGLCSDMYSDNGTNFVGAKAVLEKDFRRHLHQLKEELPNVLDQGINWHLIPPGAPHFGGIWESAVKSTKFHLRRIIGNSSLTFEELTTLTTQIESCLNSRPMCPVTSDPSDLTALTPGHFLIGAPILSIPEPSYLNHKEHSLTRWQYIQQLMQSFWRRWQNDYVTQLQQRPKWNVQTRNLQKDDLVLIKQENLPPCKWLLGRVIETHEGSDNLVRVASIKTKDSICKRPITKLCLLPIETNPNQQ